VVAPHFDVGRIQPQIRPLALDRASRKREPARLSRCTAATLGSCPPQHG
jgi:hypothetical protein